MTRPYAISPRFAAALRRARYEQFDDDPAKAARAAKLFRRLRRTRTFRTYLQVLADQREERASARLLRTWA